MIYVWSNGEHYSDHVIRFISTDLYGPDVVTAALLVKDPSGRLLLSADQVEWFEGESCELADLFEWDDWILALHKAGLPDSLVRAAIDRYFERYPGSNNEELKALLERVK